MFPITQSADAASWALLLLLGISLYTLLLPAFLESSSLRLHRGCLLETGTLKIRWGFLWWWIFHFQYSSCIFFTIWCPRPSDHSGQTLRSVTWNALLVNFTNRIWQLNTTWLSGFLFVSKCLNKSLISTICLLVGIHICISTTVSMRTEVVNRKRSH